MSVYASTARFDAARAMSEDELRRHAPSIFATAAHDSRSDRFQPIPTIEILRALTKEGFVPVGAKQSGTRDATKIEFTKHLIRLRRIDDPRQFRVGDTVCEILLKNANDGTSAYELMAGLFRIQCLNSLVAQTGTVDSIKVRHSGDVEGKVIEGTYRVLAEAEKALVAPTEWSTVKLDAGERQAFAESAHMLRFADAEGEVNSAIKPEQMLAPRRRADVSNDLWMTYNVVQENAVRGGLRGFTRDGNGRPRRVQTREVKGIDQDVKLNRALWTLTQKMAELKGIKASI
ncbi:DUF932 domain-containing protein [Agrobacterium pusense]|uniref:DUF945 domain-containing protein n=1 Tax=Agrobacterium pusense TaxID=648995 RepID=A0AA44EGZ0_9HYPH|nr:DUF932 domain-containing protein [Agrobacterium pusense]MDH2091970.1 DUF945 domain-containing protein [Agrobacterium pusense]NRF07731.1 DUF945 domain-containing protein [Agrobacterium pusense]NRF18028.1 DUF945 domain-containing protein [Agrobacterium pusense]PZU64928.1 MAG: DUF945 domain-containing protein [Rhizobium sp.]